MRWYAVLFWIWVAISVGVLLWRALNRSSPSRPAVEGEALRRPTLDERTWPPPPPDDATSPPVEETQADAHGDDATSSPDHAGIDAGEGPVPPAEPAATEEGPSEPWPFDPSPGRAAPTLADLLAGITLPHELVPLTHFSGDLDLTRHVVVATDTASAEEVGTALADELERLGYTVTATGDRTATADGPRGRVHVEIHPDPARVLEGQTLRFPSAGAGSVVVELRVG